MLQVTPANFPGSFSSAARAEQLASVGEQLAREKADDNSTTRKAFDAFVGQTFYGHMLSAMRKSVDKPAYFHGGRAEEVFQAQLDQLMAEEMAENNAEKFTGPMYALFNLQR